LDQSQSSVKNLLVSTKTMGAELEVAQRTINATSNQVLQLLQRLHDEGTAAQKMETSLLNKQKELKRALASAEWLASSMKAKYEAQVGDLAARCDALEKRVQHMDVLERQNVELCAIARQHLSSSNKENKENEVMSHAVKDVNATTSPPAVSLLSPIRGATAVTAVTAVAGLAIMSCAARQ
jgi:hypothetical protein